MEYRSPWDKKEEMKNKAKQHYIEMAKKYKAEIDNSVSKTIIYDKTGRKGTKPKEISCTGNKMPKIELYDLDTVSGAIKLEQELDLNTNDKSCPITVLNFASYKNPGGGFLNGSMAQEEALCHESCLYNVLEKFQVLYYDENLLNKNRSLYTDKALYSPEIVFEKHGCPHKFNVLTCASPNFNSAQKYCHIDEQTNYKVLKERIDFMFKILIEQKCKNLVLGAWGCGVFGQNPKIVANLFLEKIKEYSDYFNIIVFAIPSSKFNNNLEKFKEILV